ncbi:HAD family hydrolase [Neptunomonas sp.]|uniref:HAD family hydrolase n=1 Tax=Neptunomonas sp. TaxID=1971898 RepID=UPI0025DA1CED|nr:HAD family hydrolase [Neptunomonas sp.]
MSIVVFTDIDDTLIQTKRKCESGVEMAVTAIDKEAQPASFSSVEQLHFYNLCNDQRLIPVTGRNKEALDRVSLSFSTYKVIDHGAIILNEENKVEADWLQVLTQESTQWQEILDRYVEEVLSIIAEQQLSLRCRVISDFGFPCYISIKGEPTDLTKLEGIAERFCQQAGNARVHINGNNMALLPPYACKKRAVEFLQKILTAHQSNLLFLGVGDSTSDLAFMSSCHFQVIPSVSQISQDKLL